MKINTKALTISTTVVIWLVVAMTLWAELSAPFKSLIAQIGNHHWIGKSLIAVVAFVLIYLIFVKSKESDNVFKNALWVTTSVVLGGLTIFIFYLWHFLSA